MFLNIFMSGKQGKIPENYMFLKMKKQIPPAKNQTQSKTAGKLARQTKSPTIIAKNK